MRRELVSHFFLLPQTVPLAISCSIRGWSKEEAHSGGCCLVYRTRARTMAELLTDQPSASVASRLRCRRRVSSSWVMVWERTRKGGFLGVVLERAISEIISQRGATCHIVNKL
jgi:hypothetical protein